MSLAFGNIKHNTNGAAREAIVDLTFADPYAAGGESFDVSNVAPSVEVGTAFDFVQVGDTAANSFVYDYETKKLLALAAGVEVADATDLSATPVKVLVRYGQVS